MFDSSHIINFLIIIILNNIYYLMNYGYLIDEILEKKKQIFKLYKLIKIN